GDNPTGGADHRHSGHPRESLAAGRSSAQMPAHRLGSAWPSLLASGVPSLLLNQRCPFLFDLCQGLRDLVGGHARGLEIEPHAFGIVSPIDPINEILAGSARDVDRAHRASFPY